MPRTRIRPRRSSSKWSKWWKLSRKVTYASQLASVLERTCSPKLDTASIGRPQSASIDYIHAVDHMASGAWGWRGAQECVKTRP